MTSARSIPLLKCSLPLVPLADRNGWSTSCQRNAMICGFAFPTELNTEVEFRAERQELHIYPLCYCFFICKVMRCSRQWAGGVNGIPVAPFLASTQSTEVAGQVHSHLLTSPFLFLLLFFYLAGSILMSLLSFSPLCFSGIRVTDASVNDWILMCNSLSHIHWEYTGLACDLIWL